MAFVPVTRIPKSSAGGRIVDVVALVLVLIAVPVGLVLLGAPIALLLRGALEVFSRIF